MKLMILDGNSIINRAYYGIRPLTTREGFHTNGIFGFLSILDRLKSEEKPDALCVAFDLKAPTFRHKMYDGYKATRHGMPEELAMQMPVMKEVLTAMEIPIFQQEGWEADDVLGTVGKLCGESGWECVIVSGDKDNLQLISPTTCVKLITSRMGQTTTTRFDEAKFHEEYGFAPKGLIDLKSLMGDSSDNIPGVAGVGQKTAGQLMLDFGSLEAIYENIDSDKIKPAVRKKLEAGRESAKLSYDLATIRCDAPITFHPEECRVQGPNKPELLALFRKLEFTKLVDKYHLLDGDAPAVVPKVEVKTLAVMPCLGTPCAVCFSDDFSQIAVATGEGAIVLDCEKHCDYVRSLFALQTPKVCADAKTLYHALWSHDLPANGIAFDVSLAAYVLDPAGGDRGAVQMLGDGWSDLASRASGIYGLWKSLEEKLTLQGAMDLYTNVEHPLTLVLAKMERQGIAVDNQALTTFGTMLSSRIGEIQSAIFDMAEGEFNVNSTQQLGQILFEKLGLPAGKKTKTGYSTNADVLEKLKDKHPIIPLIMEYRMLAKLNSTYAEGLHKVIGEDGRIHTTFQNMVTATGRLSSTEPNLQNIPVRTPLGSEIRKMFVPAPGMAFVDADYSQIELRVLAHIAKDETMISAFQNGQDIHTVTASQVFHVAPENVTSLMRRNAKAVNFGIVYGISEFSLAEDIGVSRWEAKEYIENYLGQYHGVRNFMKTVVEQAKQDGFVTTMMGRRRYLPELSSSNFNIRSFGERCAMNTPIQGSAADIIKLAMVKVSDALEEQFPEAKMVLQVHDELIVECPKDQAEQVAKLLETQMEQVLELAVPLLAEAKTGESWYDAK